jgi:ubiquitin-like protein Nedd8
MRVWVQTLTGALQFINVHPSDTILRVKEKIQDITGIPPEMQYLIYNGKLIEKDEHTVSDYNIIFETVICQVLRLKGNDSTS